MDLHLERANHTTTPCAEERKKGDGARADECKEEQGEQGQTNPQHDWDDTGDKDGRYRVQMTSDGEKTVRHSQKVTSRSTEFWWHATKIDQISCSRQCRHIVRRPTQQCVTRQVPVATEWQLGSVLPRTLGRRPSRSTISVGWSDHERRTLSEGVDEEAPGGVSVHWAEPVNSRSIQVSKVRHKESRNERESRQLDGEATTGTENRTADENHGQQVRGAPSEARRIAWREASGPTAARGTKPEHDVSDDW